MTEPKRLKRGKEFQDEVRKDFEHYNKDGTLTFEGIRKLANKRNGRMDILISDLGDFVAVYEIKATNWDRIKSKNIYKNAWSHQHQLMKYVNTYVNENINVCLGIIYPAPPNIPGLKEKVEKYLDQYGIPAYWFNEIKGA